MGPVSAQRAPRGDGPAGGRHRHEGAGGRGRVSSTEPSSISFFQWNDISSVDDIDNPPGRWRWTTRSRRRGQLRHQVDRRPAAADHPGWRRPGLSPVRERRWLRPFTPARGRAGGAAMLPPARCAGSATRSGPHQLPGRRARLPAGGGPRGRAVRAGAAGGAERPAGLDLCRPTCAAGAYPLGVRASASSTTRSAQGEAAAPSAARLARPLGGARAGRALDRCDQGDRLGRPGAVRASGVSGQARTAAGAGVVLLVLATNPSICSTCGRGGLRRRWRCSARACLGRPDVAPIGRSGSSPRPASWSAPLTWASGRCWETRARTWSGLSPGCGWC